MDSTNVNRVKSLVIGDPFDPGIPDMIVFPIGTSYIPEVTEAEKENFELTTASGLYSVGTVDASFQFSANSSSSTTYLWDTGAKVEYVNENKDHDITNLLFYNMSTGESYPLFEDTLHILSFAIHKEFEKDLILYRVVKNDYNNDSLYNAQDPIMLYASTLDGSEMIQLTNEMHQFVDYTYYEEHNKLLAKTRIDADKDSAFTKFDETNFTEIDLLNPSFGREIFPTDMKEMLYAQIGQDK